MTETKTDPNAQPIQPTVIWLSPSCIGCSRYGAEQEWCTEPQDTCPECDMPWTRYVVDKRFLRKETPRRA